MTSNKPKSYSIEQTYKKWLTKKHLNLIYHPQKCENASGAIRESRHVCKLTRYKVNWDSPKESNLMRLVQEIRLLRVKEAVLKDVRRKAKQMYVEFDHRWNTLEAKQRELRTLFGRFNNFVIENSEKRDRGLKKILEEQKVIANRENMVNEMANKIDLLKITKDEFEDIIKKYKIYEDYLIKAVDAMHMKDPLDAMLRYSLLMTAKKTIEDKRVQDMDEFDALKHDLEHRYFNYNNELQEAQSKMVLLTLQHEKMKNRSLKWEVIVSEVRAIMFHKLSEVEMVKKAIGQLYENAFRRKALPPEEMETDYVEQIKVIKTTLNDLRNVKRKMKQSSRSTIF